MKKAVREYRNEEDMLKSFTEERCTIDPDKKTSRKFLFDTYVDWSKANGYERHWTQRKFALELQKLSGIKPDDSNREWFGIEVNSFSQAAPKDAPKAEKREN
jgi:phage/plasmid-associated DNA primase